MSEKVNLDALIPREDFEIDEVNSSNGGKRKDTISITDLYINSFFFPAIRKPDFQRETNEWDAEKVCSLIESFLDGDLIPAIILWRNENGYIFVIDGSHRLSALAAWINDDYGDGKISKEFYDAAISDEQKKIAEDSRKLINKKIGSFVDYELGSRAPNKVNAEIAARAKRLASLALQLQWVEGNAKKAEDSFYKINQKAAPINPTELRLIKARYKPNGLAARAIIRSGKGHNYWSKFSQEIQLVIQDLSKEVNDILFKPEMKNPIKTLDLPLGGKLYSNQGLSLILETINITNHNEDEDKENEREPKKESINNEEVGNKTIHYLKTCRKVLQRINTNHPGSLGLHPIVYIYSSIGKFRVASFYAIIRFVMYLEEKKKLKQFIEIRRDFEEMLINSEGLIQQIARKHREALPASNHIRDFYIEIFDLLVQGKEKNSIITHIIKETKFRYLKLQVDNNYQVGKEFSKEVKSAAFIKEAMKGCLRCPICNGYIHTNSTSVDHIERRQDGGEGKIINAQVTHPYCNTSYKN